MLQKRLLFGLVMIVAVVISACEGEAGFTCDCGEAVIEIDDGVFTCMTEGQLLGFALAEFEEAQVEVPEGFVELFHEVWAEEVGTCAGPVNPVAPGLWPSDVCEPIDGFSGDGWNTWDTNADEFGFSTQLYVGTSIDGPWFATEYTYPPYIFNMASLQALADWMGVASYEQLWFKVDEAGSPVNWASAIADRDAYMDELCGVE